MESIIPVQNPMSLQRWTDEDTFALIGWAADESIAAIKAGQYADAEILHRGIAAIIGMGQMLMTNDSRLNKWLDLKLSIISYPLRDKSSLCSIITVTCSSLLHWILSAVKAKTRQK